MRPRPTAAVRLPLPDGWLSEDDRPNVYTEADAARRVGVTRRTIRQWRAEGRLKPIEGSLEKCGQYVYDGPSLTEAERSARRGRARRRRLLT